MMQMMWTRHIPIISTLIDEALAKATTITLIKWAQNFWHHLLENNTQTPWSVQDIQMLWYDWCEIHTLNAVIGARYPNAVIWLMRDTYPNAAIWLVRDTYPNAAIWLVRYITLHANIEFSFFLQKKVTQKGKLRFYDWLTLITIMLWIKYPGDWPLDPNYL